MTESISRKFSKLGSHVSATGTITTNAATASAWETARTLTLSGDVSGSASISGAHDITLTATVSGNSITLGTDTTGDYVASVSAGTGITATGSGESAAVTVALAASGVTASSYGSSTAVPVLTIDTYGRITSATTASVSSGLNIAGDTGTDSVSLISDTLTVAGGTGLSSTVTNNTVTLDIDNTVATLTGAQTLTNKTISGADNTLSNIANSSLTNSTISGIALGSNLADLTVGTGVALNSGTTYNGGTAKTISIGQAVGTSDNVTFNDVVVSGNLTVSGTTTTINTETINLADNTVVLNSNETGTPSQDAGIEVERGTSSNVTLLWDETNDRWTVGSQNFVAGTFVGALSGNASTVTNGVYTTDTGTVTNTMLAGSIANNKLANSTISGVALGSNLGTLTMGVSGTGLSGSQTYNGSGAATFTVTSNATSANTASTIVARDGSGNFTAGTITAALSGNATTATTAGSITSQANSATITATTAATADRIVLRDGNGDIFARYGFASYFNMSHGVSGATTDTVFYSSYDDYIRKNNATGFRASLNVPTRTGGDASGTWGIRITGFANQGSQRLYSTDAAYNYDSGAPYFGYLTYDGSRWLFQVSPATPAAVRVAYADAAGSADQIDGRGFVNTGSNSGTNANTIASNGISYVTGSIALFGQTDGALFSQAYNDDWQHQIFGDYRTGQIAIRGKQSGSFQSWRTVLDSSNYSSYALPLSGGTMSGLIYSVGLQPVGVGGNSGVSGDAYKFGYQEAGAWTHPYPDLIIGYHTGMKFGGNTSYGGMRFYADHPQYNPAELFSIGNGDNHVRVANQLIVGSSATIGSNLRLTGGGYGSDAISSSSPNGAGRVFAPQGAAGSWDGTQTGAIKIRLPFKANNPMWYMTVKIYNYSGRAISEYKMGNYSYSDGSYNSAATCHADSGAPIHNVRFGNDGSYDCVWIGETSTSWTYPVVAVTDFSAGFRSGEASNTSSNWNISIVTSFNTVGGTLYPASNTGYQYAYAYYGNSNVAGTGSASYHPSGIYSTGTNWLYGAMYLNNNNINGCGTIYTNNWFRSYGATGWYNETYGAGIRMEDGSWVRVYGTVGFYATAEIAAVGNITAYYSDERLKTKTGSISDALSKVMGLNGFFYVENDVAKAVGYKNDKQQVGVSAQEVQAILPEAVSLAPFDMHTEEDGTIVSKSGETYLTVDYSRLVPLLIEAIKEQQRKINELEKRINNS